MRLCGLRNYFCRRGQCAQRVPAFERAMLAGALLELGQHHG